MTAEINRININATRNLGVKLLKNSLKTSMYKAANKIVPSKILRGKINSLNEKKAELLTAPVQNVIAENQKLLADNTQLKTDLSEAMKIFKTKEKFFNLMVHDLRSPFCAIQGFSNIIVNNLKNDFSAFSEEDYKGIREISGYISFSSDKVFQMINDLNALRVATTGQLTLKEFNLYGAVGSMKDIAAVSAAKKGVEIKNLTPDDLCINGDETIIKTIIGNLISNAIKFTPSGGVVTITANRVNGNPVEISVADNGVGIRPEDMSKLFKMEVDKPFTHEGTNGEPGTGFGLPVCWELVKSHGGNLWAESNGSDKGSTFKFTVPKEPKLQTN